jgi:hypothetical protein
VEATEAVEAVSTAGVAEVFAVAEASVVAARRFMAAAFEPEVRHFTAAAIAPHMFSAAAAMVPVIATAVTAMAGIVSHTTGRIFTGTFIIGASMGLITHTITRTAAAGSSGPITARERSAAIATTGAIIDELRGNG